ncbi:MAG: hypothetical protein ACXVK3_02415, partial [Candidatus Angelobacter sp.]
VLSDRYGGDRDGNQYSQGSSHSQRNAKYKQRDGDESLAKSEGRPNESGDKNDQQDLKCEGVDDELRGAWYL